MNHMNASTMSPPPRGYGFAIGLLAGTCAGAGLALWLAPRATAELRQRLADSARKVQKETASQYEHLSRHAGEAIGEATRTAQDARDVVVEAVARGAREVERVATAAKSVRLDEMGKHSADRSTSASNSL